MNDDVPEEVVAEFEADLDQEAENWLDATVAAYEETTPDASTEAAPFSRDTDVLERYARG